jgi:hypothetical protein
VSKNSSVFANLFNEQPPLVAPPVRLQWEESALKARTADDSRRLEARDYLRQVPPPRNISMRRG